MSDTPIKSLNELIECGIIQLTRGKIISKKDIAACPGTYPIYSSAKDNEGKFGEYGKYLFDEELITWSVDGGGRLFHRPKHKFSVTNVGGVLRILDKSVIEYRYLYHALTLRHSEIVFDWVKKAHPSVIRKLYAGIPIPPLPEQQRIVALLDEAFAGLATAKANAERNLQNTRAIFSSHLEAVFSEQGEGWEETTIGETCTLKSGTTVSPALERPGGDVPYLKVADMSFEGNEDQITSSSRFLMRADIKESALIPTGATIFPKRGGAIMTNKKRIAALPICADLNIMSVIPSRKISARLLYYYFLNVDMRKLGSGSSIPQINNYDVEPLEISFPESLATQEELIRAFDDLSAETKHLTRLYERKLAALEELKKSVLHQAFNGEI